MLRLREVDEAASIALPRWTLVLVLGGQALVLLLQGSKPPISFLVYVVALFVAMGHGSKTAAART